MTIEASSSRGLHIMRDAVVIWSGHRTPSGYETRATTLADPLLRELLTLVYAGDPQRRGR